jgi:hypothetical protein
MTAFRALADVRMQCSFDQADAALLAALVLHLRGFTDGFLCHCAERTAALLWRPVHSCDLGHAPVMPLAAAWKFGCAPGR